MKNKGFSAIELLLVLAVIAGLFIMVIRSSEAKLQQTKSFNLSDQAFDYATAGIRYIEAHYSLLENILSDNGQGNGLVVTVPLQLLKSEGFISSNYPEKNYLRQYPCLIINYANNQIQAFVYYRDNDNAGVMNPLQWNAGLEHIGGMIGIYNNGLVNGHGWNLNTQDTHNLFINYGTADPSNGRNSAAYQCHGSSISNPAYVINLASMLVLNNRLPNDAGLHQYPDVQNQPGNVQNTNTMLSSINMDSRNVTGTIIKSQQQLVFQINPQCPAGQTDCQNKQLSVAAARDFNNDKIIQINGFQPGGNSVKYNLINQKQPYVGEVKANSIQPLASISVATQCSVLELGKIARQPDSGGSEDINNLYINQVQCMLSPFCPATSGGYCYMPVNTVTLNGKPNTPSYICPAGMALTGYSENHADAPDWGAHCCQSAMGVCIGYASAHDHVWDGVKYSYLANVTGSSLTDGVQTGLVHYRYTCDAICMCPGDDATVWQPVITSFTCSNDITQIALPVSGE